MDSGWWQSRCRTETTGQTLVEDGLSAYPAQRPAVLGQVVTRAPVESGMQKTVPLVAADSFSWPVAEGEKLDMRMDLEAPLVAPLSAGNYAGQAVFLLNEIEVGRVDLLCGANIAPKVETALNILKLYLPQ